MDSSDLEKVDNNQEVAVQYLNGNQEEGNPQPSLALKGRAAPQAEPKQPPNLTSVPSLSQEGKARLNGVNTVESRVFSPRTVRQDGTKSCLNPI